ncbi:sensor histidine kinase [Nocardiopsis trehalosi]|uniref:sensor histidine kinase n=1 Tax=Nocardiopsis trehalosi TaxID=109329 RepID=UPI000835C297|nr:histidine kinase [Nocardiopsis trehalosi]
MIPPLFRSRLRSGDVRGEDAVLTAVLLLPLLLDAFGGPAGGRAPFVVAVGVPLVTATAVLARRHPLAALAVPLTALLAEPLVHPADVLAPAFVTPAVATAVLALLAGRRLPDTDGFIRLLAVAALAGLVARVAAETARRGAFGAVAGVLDWLTLLVAMAVVVLLPWLVGRYRRQAVDLARAGWERAGLLEAQQRISEDRARLRERGRIAQDMHDSLGHDLSLIALRAAALEVAPGLDPAHRSAAAELRADVAAAAERLRDVIGVLRPDGGAAPEDPTRVGVSELVERAAAAGVPVTVDITADTGSGAGTGSRIGTVRSAARPVAGGAGGDPLPTGARDGVRVDTASPGGAADPVADSTDDPGSGSTDDPTHDSTADPAANVPPMVLRAAARVVQEALTNAAKHAPGADVAVRVRHLPDRTEVVVDNGPPPGGDTAPAARRGATARVPVAAGRVGGRGPGRGSVDAAPTAEPARAPSGAVPSDAGPGRPAPGGGRAAPDRPAPGGYGLVGLHERVRLLGGTLRAGPAGNGGHGGQGGFTVTAVLPHDAPPGADDAAAVGGGPVDASGAHAASASARQHRERARLTRRRLTSVFAVPLGAVAAIGLVLLAVEGALSTGNDLDGAVYADLRIGDDRDAVTPRLPFLQTFEDHSDLAPAPPRGADCVSYWTEEQTDDRLFYRLCFVDGRLATKDVFPRAALSPSADTRPDPAADTAPMGVRLL